MASLQRYIRLFRKRLRSGNSHFCLLLQLPHQAKSHPSLTRRISFRDFPGDAGNWHRRPWCYGVCGRRDGWGGQVLQGWILLCEWETLTGEHSEFIYCESKAKYQICGPTLDRAVLFFIRCQIRSPKELGVRQLRQLRHLRHLRGLQEGSWKDLSNLIV